MNNLAKFDFNHFLKLLANPTRYEIFSLLMTGNHCHCEMAEKLNVSLSLLSHHLNALTNCGLVSASRDPSDARWVHYRINTQVLEGLRQEFMQRTDPGQIHERASACIPTQENISLSS